MSEDWNHQYVEANGIRIHYVRHGAGSPIVLLHGWPGFWYVWHKNILPLSEHFDIIVPDQRGFGDSDKPAVPASTGYSKHVRAEDLKALVDALGLERVGIVTHDMGSWVTQTFAIKYPHLVSGLLLFNCPYPGIGDRWSQSGHLKEIWYMWFHQQPWAAKLVGASRDNVRLYFGHFLSHLSHDPRAFEDDLENWVDNYLKPGNLQGGFDWYTAADAERMAMIEGKASQPPKIQAPTRVLWGESDPVIKVEWADRLGDYFSNYSFASVPQAGHFLQYEKPNLLNDEVIRHFENLRLS